jgi:hypothetical protein
MIRSSLFIIFIFITNSILSQIRVADVGDGWKNKVDSAISIIKKYDLEKYNVLLESCTDIGYWNGSFSTTEGDSMITIAVNDIKNPNIYNIAAILVHESMHLYIKQLYSKLDPNKEEALCYKYELNFLMKIPGVDPWLVSNAVKMIEYYEK